MRIFEAALAVSLVLWARPLVAQEVRSWKDSTGRVIQAEFVSGDSKTVKLRMNGTEYPLPMEKLSAEDQAWVKTKLSSAPSADAAPPTGTPTSAQVAGVTVTPGAKIEFETPLSAALMEKVKKRSGKFEETYKDVDMTRAQVGLFVPEGFTPAKTWPIMIVSVTDSGRAQGKFPSSIKAMGSFMDAARTLGWVVIAADCPGNLTPGLPFNRCALAEAALDALSAAWPASKTWPVATGGFSGGAKYSGWLGGWFCEAGRNVVGMFMGGCNQDMTTYALDELKPPRKQFTAAKVFLSTGKEDKIAGPAKTGEVISSLKRSGFEVREEQFDGAHEVNKDHILEAMKWFADAPSAGKK